MNADKIKQALAYVHYWEKRSSGRQAARDARQIMGLSVEEGAVLLRTLHLPEDLFNDLPLWTTCPTCAFTYLGAHICPGSRCLDAYEDSEGVRYECFLRNGHHGYHRASAEGFAWSHGNTAQKDTPLAALARLLSAAELGSLADGPDGDVPRMRADAARIRAVLEHAALERSNEGT